MTVIDRLTLSLRDGPARCELAPGAGGALASFWWQDGRQRFDWLHGATTGAVASGDARRLAAYPILPYAGAIRGGGFHFCGRDVAEIPGDAADGHGWQRPWRVTERDDNALSLEYRHEGLGWPWPYLARQRVALADGALAVTIELENLADTMMPAGLGLRLALPAEPATMLLPALAPEVELAPWDGAATLSWPRRHSALTIAAEQPIFGFLRVERSADATVTALSPLSQCADAINRARAGAAGTGLRVLAPGARRSATVTLRPRFL